MKEYALYYGDDLLAIGTRKEIAERRGVKLCTIQHYGTSAYKRKVAKRTSGRDYMMLVRI